ncbi:hypothetical protein [Methanolobus bombayensis]|uniref:hypothetical protein n=1 Tax=Methanolobus bombayensis TaxID=38023 RepID=UPI001AE982B4|nr:hypothetical protein [Methanolobus bombayensis]MBP1908564.1 hypothetical protein [Methanolobus bombayensis]
MIIEIHGIEIEIHERFGECRVISANGKPINEKLLSRILTGTAAEKDFGVFAVGGSIQMFAREEMGIRINLPTFKHNSTPEEFTEVLNRRLTMIEDAFEERAKRGWR